MDTPPPDPPTDPGFPVGALTSDESTRRRLPATGPERFIGAAVAGIFGVIGLCVIGFMATMDPHEFGTPPLFFRIFASLIGLAFVIVGFGGAAGALRAKAAPHPPGTSAPRTGYQCPHCGAGLGKAEVSPSGDIKCAYCHKWYNIHAPR
jgi:hypothetical protein